MVRHPPVLWVRVDLAAGDVHDGVAQAEERFRWEGLGKDVCQVVRAFDVLDVNDVLFDAFAHVKVATVDVFCAIVMLGVVCEVNRRLIVHTHGGRSGLG